MALSHFIRRSISSAALGTSLFLLGGLVGPVASVAAQAPGQTSSLESVQKSRPTDAKVYHTRFKADSPDGIREVAIEGAVRFTPDESRIAWLADGAYVRIIFREQGQELRFDATADGQGHPVIAYGVDGKTRRYDQDAARTLAALLPVVFRELGHDPTARVQAAYEQGGAEEVLRLIAGIRSDYSIGRHISAFLAMEGVSDDEVSDGFRLLGRHIKSDAELASVLYRTSDLYRQRPGVRDAYLACLDGFQSAIEKSRATENLFGVGTISGDLQPDLVMPAGGC